MKSLIPLCAILALTACSSPNDNALMQVNRDLASSVAQKDVVGAMQHSQKANFVREQIQRENIRYQYQRSSWRR